MLSIRDHLMKLNLSETAIEDVQPLATCRNLLELNLCGTTVMDLMPLDQCNHLQRLWIDESMAAACHDIQEIWGMLSSRRLDPEFFLDVAQANLPTSPPSTVPCPRLALDSEDWSQRKRLVSELGRVQLDHYLALLNAMNHARVRRELLAESRKTYEMLTSFLDKHNWRPQLSLMTQRERIEDEQTILTRVVFRSWETYLSRALEWHWICCEIGEISTIERITEVVQNVFALFEEAQQGIEISFHTGFSPALADEIAKRHQLSYVEFAILWRGTYTSSARGIRLMIDEIQRLLDDEQFQQRISSEFLQHLEDVSSCMDMLDQLLPVLGEPISQVMLSRERRDLRLIQARRIMTEMSESNNARLRLHFNSNTMEVSPKAFRQTWKSFLSRFCNEFERKLEPLVPLLPIRGKTTRTGTQLQPRAAPEIAQLQAVVPQLPLPSVEADEILSAPKVKVKTRGTATLISEPLLDDGIFTDVVEEQIDDSAWSVPEINTSGVWQYDCWTLKGKDFRTVCTIFRPSMGSTKWRDFVRLIESGFGAELQSSGGSKYVLRISERMEQFFANDPLPVKYTRRIDRPHPGQKLGWFALYCARNMLRSWFRIMNPSVFKPCFCNEE